MLAQNAVRLAFGTNPLAVLDRLLHAGIASGSLKVQDRAQMSLCKCRINLEL